MAKIDRCVVRNQAYRKSGLSIRERHNERKNEGYANADIDPTRAALNVHFKHCEGGYMQAFDRLTADGTISTRGLQKDAKVVDELVFDVNTAYFERGGGYEYARDFFAEAYRLAVQEAGGEQYILSAVMHADERNKALSEQLGRDVYHYHLHVVYVPVVEKKIKWSKRCKDPALFGTTKEVIQQVSHSKKWASEKALDENGSVILNENGRAVFINAYSLLQDRFFEHMRAAGYHDFERGERGSTAAHLSALDYKIQQEQGRADTLDGSVKQAEEQLATLQDQLAVTSEAHATYMELEGMGKKTLLGRYEVRAEEWKTLLTLAKSGVASQGVIYDLKHKLSTALQSAAMYQERWEDLRGRTRDYLELERIHPIQTRAAVEALKRLHRPAPPVKSHAWNHRRGRGR